VDVYRRLLGALRRAGTRETGGILMGEQLAPGDFRIADISFADRPGSEAHFTRSPEEHRKALDTFFAGTRSDYARFNYLGEWHSHPSFTPLPSGADIMAMRELVDEEPDIAFSVLLICRELEGSLELSATLFQRGVPHERAEILSGQAIDAHVESNEYGEDDNSQ